jgi:hypothetical protein
MAGGVGDVQTTRRGPDRSEGYAFNVRDDSGVRWLTLVYASEAEACA